MSRGKRIYKRWKSLLFGSKSHELLVFCFFLAVSFGFWLLQALNETLEREVQVNLQLVNVPSDVVIIDSLPPAINVILQDRGLELARHSFSSLFRPNRVKIDFTEYDNGEKDAEVHISNADMTRLISRIFDVSTKVQLSHSDTIRYSYNHNISRILPVRLTGTIKASQQHYIQDISIKPDSVRVFAPRSVLDTMRAVYSETFLLDSLYETGSHQIRLRKQRLQKYDPGQVDVNVKVDFYTEMTLQVPVIGLNFPAEKKLRTFPGQVTVKFNVEYERSKHISAEDFVLATTYEELLQNTDGSKLQLNLKTIPEGVSDISITPQEVDYLIEQVETPL